MGRRDDERMSRCFLIIVALLLSAAGGAPSLAQDQPIVGPARIIDGDTLEVAGVRIRLFGIDAPEMDQTCEWPNKTISCGNMSKLAMMDLLATGGNVTCEPIEKDRYGRTVATCIAPDGFDISWNMVYTGWALAYRRYSEKYVAVENRAREAKHGMWKGEFVKPWDWRRGERSTE